MYSHIISTSEPFFFISWIPNVFLIIFIIYCKRIEILKCVLRTFIIIIIIIIINVLFSSSKSSHHENKL